MSNKDIKKIPATREADGWYEINPLCGLYKPEHVHPV